MLEYLQVVAMLSFGVFAVVVAAGSAVLLVLWLLDYFDLL